MRISALTHRVATVDGAPDDALLEGLKRIQVFCEGLR
jgi:hypothetical protein